MTTDHPAAGEDEAWRAVQAELRDLSPNNERLTAEGSGHNVLLDQPAAAAAAIKRSVDLVRRPGA